MAVLRVFPHCDLHLALNTPGAEQVEFRVFRYLTQANGTFNLDDVTGDCEVRMMAPHNAVGNRLQEFVDVDVNLHTITAHDLGTNLVVLQRNDDYIVVRIQVHDEVEDWFFGNAKVTAPLDAQNAHAQPSIYARFSDDNTGTDLVGDITGHGFVTLTSSDTGVFDVANTHNEGRILGLAAGTRNLEGDFLGTQRTIEVEVVDYTTTRNIIEPVRAGNLADASERHNILFLPEGFTDTQADRDKFDAIVTQAVDELFSKRRHEPYGALADSFNVFKAYIPSEDRLITCGFQVTDNAVDELAKGRPIPYEERVGNDDSKYEIAQLVARVGLPRRGENRNAQDLVNLWKSQFLHDFKEEKVDEGLANAWKNSHSQGFLEARNTFFGMMIGARWADRRTDEGDLLDVPASDTDNDDMRALIRRCYEFYRPERVARSISMDIRRYAPQTMLSGNESRASPFMTFLAGLRMAAAPNEAIGPEWVPDGTTFKRSRGLIAMIINEHMDGGTNLNDSTVTANNIENDAKLEAAYLGPADTDSGVMRRTVPGNLEPDLTSTINTIAHEFGHSFNLGDEYEEFPGDLRNILDPAQSDSAADHDNLESIRTVFDDPDFQNNNSRDVDITKANWTDLPRTRLSARLTATSSINAGNLEVEIDPGETAPWEAARVAGDPVHIRRIRIQPDGQQFPLSTTQTDHLTGLTIESVNQANGTIVLSGPGIGPPDFPAGTSMYVLLRDEDGSVIPMVEPKVQAHMIVEKKPLNKDTNTADVNKKPDHPVEIDDFKPPCKDASLLGLYEGGSRYTGLVYRPSGTCKMRTSGGEDEHGEFCHVCKWLITNRVDAGKHAEVDRRFYPVAKKNE